MRSLKRAAMVAAFTATALVGVTSSASAVTLHDGTATDGVVANGATATGVSGSVTFDGWVNPTCSSSTLTASVTDNTTSDGDPLEARITGSAWAGCSLTTTGNHGAGKWILKADGTVVNGGYVGRVDNVDVTIGSCRFTGNLVDQNVGGAAGSHAEIHNGNHTFGSTKIHLDNAQSLSGFCGSGDITGLWAFQNTWHLH